MTLGGRWNDLSGGYRKFLIVLGIICVILGAVILWSIPYSEVKAEKISLLPGRHVMQEESGMFTQALPPIWILSEQDFVDLVYGRQTTVSRLGNDVIYELIDGKYLFLFRDFRFVFLVDNGYGEAVNPVIRAGVLISELHRDWYAVLPALALLAFLIVVCLLMVWAILFSKFSLREREMEPG